MSEQDVEIARRMSQAFADRDLDAVAAVAAEGFELNPLMSVWQRTYIGVDGVGEWLRDLEGLWASFDVDVSEYREVRPGVVLVLGRWHGTPLGEQMETIDAPIAGVVRVQDGRLSRADFYLNEELALAAAGDGG